MYRLIATLVLSAAKSILVDRGAEAFPSFLGRPTLELYYGGQRSRDSKKGLRTEMAARNRKTRLATLEKTPPSSTTLPTLQA